VTRLREGHERVRRSGLLLVLAACGACATVLGIEAPEPRDASSDGAAAADAPRNLGTSEGDEGAVDAADAADATDGAADAVPDAPPDASPDASGADVVTSEICNPKVCGPTGICCANEAMCRNTPDTCQTTGAFYACRGAADCNIAANQYCCGTILANRWTFQCTPFDMCNFLFACMTDVECGTRGLCKPATHGGCPLNLPLRYCGGC
jgi:hypothetical protein